MNALLLQSAQKLRAMHALRRWIRKTQKKFSDAKATAASTLQTRGLQLNSAWLHPPPHTRTHTHTRAYRCYTCSPALFLRRDFSQVAAPNRALPRNRKIVLWHYYPVLLASIWLPVSVPSACASGHLSNRLQRSLQFGNSELGVKNSTGGGGGWRSRQAPSAKALAARCLRP